MSYSGRSVDVIVVILTETVEGVLVNPASVSDLPAVGCVDSLRKPPAS
ncbi:hypothetical protein [Rhizobium sp. IMFF44]